jgi:RNA polymerase sigma-70 factor (ECF subfamily)
MRSRGDILDELLVLRTQGGDVASLELLARRWHPRLLRHAVRLTGEAEGGADVAQDAWVAIVRGLRRLQDPGRFRAWAYRIVTRKSSDWIRSRQRRRKLDRRVSAQPVATSSEASDSSGELMRLRAELSELPADRQALLAMYYVEGMTVGEISEALAIPKGTIKSRLFHTRNQLRERLED